MFQFDEDVSPLIPEASSVLIGGESQALKPCVGVSVPNVGVSLQNMGSSSQSM